MKVLGCGMAISLLIFFAQVGATVGLTSGTTTGATKIVSRIVTVEAQEYSIIARSYEYLPAVIVLKKDVPARLYLTSVDRAHDIKIEGLGIREKVKPGEVSAVNFTPKEVRTYEYHCDIYCGPGHRGMKGKIVVVNGNESRKE